MPIRISTELCTASALSPRAMLRAVPGPCCHLGAPRIHGCCGCRGHAQPHQHHPPLAVPQVSALASAGGTENLIVLERSKHRAHEVGSVRWAGSTFGPMQKSRLGEHEFEALMRMLDNLVRMLGRRQPNRAPISALSSLSPNQTSSFRRGTAPGTPTATPWCRRRANPKAMCSSPPP